MSVARENYTSGSVKSKGVLTRKQLAKAKTGCSKSIGEINASRKKGSRTRGCVDQVQRTKKRDSGVTVNSTKKLKDKNRTSEVVDALEPRCQPTLSSSDTIIREEAVPRVMRDRKSSCDELKGELIKQNSESKGTKLNHEQFVSNKDNECFQMSNTGLLTDFERFVMENKDKDFQDTCFPSKVGEECNLCDSPSTNYDGINNTVSLCRVGNRLYSVSSFSSLYSNESHVKIPRRRLSSLSDGPDSHVSSLKSDTSGSGESFVNKFGLSMIGNRLGSMSSFSSLDSLAHELKSKALRSKRQKRRLSSLSDSVDSQELASAPKNAKRSDEKAGALNLFSSSNSIDRNDNCERASPQVSFVGEDQDRAMCIFDLEKDNDGAILGFQDESIRGDVKDTESEKQGPHSVQSAWLILCTNIPDWMYVAVDCEMVGTGPKGKNSVLGRCSIVDYRGNVVYDKFVQPDVPITDYRTKWSGILPSHLAGALPIAEALEEIYKILANKIIVGHSVYNDFRALKMSPPFYTVRDTAQCKTLVRLAGLEGQGNGLKKLTEALLDRKIQMGSSGHCSVEDARATLDLFKLVRQEFEAELYLKWDKKSNKQTISALAGFVQKAHATRGLQIRVDSNGDSQFLGDEYWPSNVTGDGNLVTA